jgi:hypothetical protein
LSLPSSSCKADGCKTLNPKLEFDHLPCSKFVSFANQKLVLICYSTCMCPLHVWDNSVLLYSLTMSKHILNCPPLLLPHTLLPMSKGQIWNHTPFQHEEPKTKLRLSFIGRTQNKGTLCNPLFVPLQSWYRLIGQWG